MALQIFPHQTALKFMQMNAATPFKENLNPWAAFAVVGVLQGGVYGQSNVHFANKLQLSTTASYKGLFRGSIFAGGRDMVSQGVPFVFSKTTEKFIFDPIWAMVFPSKTLDSAETQAVDPVKRACAVITTSICATYMSQGLHNCQIKMQADQSLSYINTLTTLWAEHGTSILYKGGSARVFLLLIVNGLNELLLKPAWEEVPV